MKRQNVLSLVAKVPERVVTVAVHIRTIGQDSQWRYDVSGDIGQTWQAKHHAAKALRQAADSIDPLPSPYRHGEKDATDPTKWHQAVMWSLIISAIVVWSFLLRDVVQWI